MEGGEASSSKSTDIEPTTKQPGEAPSSEPVVNLNDSIDDVGPTEQHGYASSSESAANHSASPIRRGTGAFLPQYQAIQVREASSARQLIRPPQVQPPLPPLVAQQQLWHYGAGESSSGPVDAISPICGAIWDYPVRNPAFVTTGNYGHFGPSFHSSAQWSPWPSASSGCYGHIARSWSHDAGHNPAFVTTGNYGHFGPSFHSVAQWSSWPSHIAPSSLRYDSSAIWDYIVLTPASVTGNHDPFGPSYHSVEQCSSMPSASSSARYAQMNRVLLRAMNPVLLMSPDTSADVIRELEKGNEKVRLCVLDTIVCNVHAMMESSVVFVPLLHACEFRQENLQAIVNAACNGKALLIRLMDHDRGKAALKELIRVAAPHLELWDPLIKRLLINERMMEKSGGVVLLYHLTNTFPYASCLILAIIEFAIKNFVATSSSRFGSTCMRECYRVATIVGGSKLDKLHEMVSSHLGYLARGRNSTRFLQGVIELGRSWLEQAIVRHVLKDLVRLSMHRSGNYLVQDCFHRPTLGRFDREQLLGSFLAEFRVLGDDQLLTLVEDRYASQVVRKLLQEAGEYALPIEAHRLAWRINSLCWCSRRKHAKQVMGVVREVLPQPDAYDSIFRQRN